MDDLREEEVREEVFKETCNAEIQDQHADHKENTFPREHGLQSFPVHQQGENKEQDSCQADEVACISGDTAGRGHSSKDTYQPGQSITDDAQQIDHSDFLHGQDDVFSTASTPPVKASNARQEGNHQHQHKPK